jgi:mono/diheme cytochrome c family protein
MRMPFVPRVPSSSHATRAAALGVTLILMSAVTVVVLAGRSPDSQQTAPQKPGTPAATTATKVTGDVARGDYLVNNVAMCVQCHSPRDQRGNIIANQKLTGASMPVRGPAWDSDWAYRTPALAGLPGFTDEQIVLLLTEGHAGDRPAPQRPMPPFRMNKQDAEAIAAYLRSR